MIVLDTHVLLWMDQGDDAIGPQSRQLIEQAWRKGLVAVCSISFWECAMLAQRGRIELPSSIELWRAELLQAGVQELGIDGRIAILAASLQDMHKDPADRFIAATAIQSGARLITADARLLDWSGNLPRQDATK